MIWQQSAGAKQQLPPLDKTHVSGSAQSPPFSGTPRCPGSIPGAIYHRACAANFHGRHPLLHTHISEMWESKREPQGVSCIKKEIEEATFLMSCLLCSLNAVHLSPWTFEFLTPALRLNSEVPKLGPEPLEVTDPYVHHTPSSDRKHKQVFFKKMQIK